LHAQIDAKSQGDRKPAEPSTQQAAHPIKSSDGRPIGSAKGNEKPLQNSQHFGQTPKNGPKSLQSQFGQNYDIKKARNS